MSMQIIGDGTCMFGGQNGQGGSPIAGYAPPNWFYTNTDGEIQCLSSAQYNAIANNTITPIQYETPPTNYIPNQPVTSVTNSNSSNIQSVTTPSSTSLTPSSIVTSLDTNNSLSSIPSWVFLLGGVGLITVMILTGKH